VTKFFQSIKSCVTTRYELQRCGVSTLVNQHRRVAETRSYIHCPASLCRFMATYALDFYDSVGQLATARRPLGRREYDDERLTNIRRFRDSNFLQCSYLINAAVISGNSNYSNQRIIQTLTNKPRSKRSIGHQPRLPITHCE